MLLQILVLSFTSLSSWTNWLISLYLNFLTCKVGIKLALPSVLGMRDNIHKESTTVLGTPLLNKQELLLYKIWKS